MPDHDEIEGRLREHAWVRGAYEDMVVTEYLEFFAAAYGIHGSQRKKVVGDVLDLTDLNYKATAEVNSLSRGMQQRLGVARVLVHDPKVLLLDEPASGLDPRARICLKDAMLNAKKEGKTLFFSSHILSDIDEICDRIGIIHDTALRYIGTATDFKPTYHETSLERAFLKAIEAPVSQAA